MQLQPRAFPICSDSGEWKNEISKRLDSFLQENRIIHEELTAYLLGDLLPLIQRAINSVSINLEGQSNAYYELWIALFEILQ